MAKRRFKTIFEPVRHELPNIGFLRNNLMDDRHVSNYVYWKIFRTFNLNYTFYFDGTPLYRQSNDVPVVCYLRFDDFCDPGERITIRSTDGRYMALYGGNQ